MRSARVRNGVRPIRDHEREQVPEWDASSVLLDSNPPKWGFAHDPSETPPRGFNDSQARGMTSTASGAKACRLRPLPPRYGLPMIFPGVPSILLAIDLLALGLRRDDQRRHRTEQTTPKTDDIIAAPSATPTGRPPAPTCRAPSPSMSWPDANPASATPRSDEPRSWSSSRRDAPRRHGRQADAREHSRRSTLIHHIARRDDRRRGFPGAHAHPRLD